MSINQVGSTTADRVLKLRNAVLDGQRKEIMLEDLMDIRPIDEWSTVGTCPLQCPRIYTYQICPV